MEKMLILSAYDFTDRGQIALAHALMLGKTTHSDVRLIHIVQHTADIHLKQFELAKIASKANKFYPYKIDSIVIKGEIVSAINRYADDINALICIIGSSGSFHGFERMFGSRTLKIILGSVTPFMVVQKPPDINNIKNVIFPINFTVENKEKLKWAQILHTYYNVKIKMFVQHENDEYTQRKINANLLFAKKYLNRYNIDYEIILARGKKDFYKELTAFAESSDSDLIMIMTSKSHDIADFITGMNEHNIISNKAKIPVMCINPRMDLIRYQSFF